MPKKVNIFWFRRDLRLNDNVGLNQALKDDLPVLLVFIFDQEILKKLPKDDSRLSFIHDTLQNISQKLQDSYNSSIAMFYGNPTEIYKNLITEYQIAKVYTNHDYEPYARNRDKKIGKLLSENAIKFETFKDQVVFEKEEITKSDDTPYVVYTPLQEQMERKI